MTCLEGTVYEYETGTISIVEQKRLGDALRQEQVAGGPKPMTNEEVLGKISEGTTLRKSLMSK